MCYNKTGKKKLRSKEREVMAVGMNKMYCITEDTHDTLNASL
jgi:hypothetical protein